MSNTPIETLRLPTGLNLGLSQTPAMGGGDVRLGAGNDPATQLSAEERTRAEAYFQQRGLLSEEYQTSSRRERDEEFRGAMRRFAESRNLQHEGLSTLLSLIMMLFGLEIGDDPQSPAAAGIDRAAPFSSRGDRSRALAGAANAGRVQPVDVEPGTRSASSLVVELAERELGVREVGNNGGQRVADYNGAGGGGAGLPWCTGFVSYIYARAGISPAGTENGGAGVGGTLRALDFQAQFQQRGAFHRFSDARPQSGDVIVFSRPNAGPGEGHVGIIQRVEGDNVFVIEGNSNDAVQLRRYSLNALSRGARNAIGFGSIDQVTAGNPRFAARGQERQPNRSQETDGQTPASPGVTPARMPASHQVEEGPGRRS